MYHNEHNSLLSYWQYVCTLDTKRIENFGSLLRVSDVGKELHEVKELQKRVYSF